MSETPLVLLVDGKKFVWDGEEWESEEAAETTERSYREQGFEVKRLSDRSKVFLYTRRSLSATEDDSTRKEVEKR
jgi:hypothetical protein